MDHVASGVDAASAAVEATLDVLLSTQSLADRRRLQYISGRSELATQSLADRRRLQYSGYAGNLQPLVDFVCSNFITRGIVYGQIEGQFGQWLTASQVASLPIQSLIDCGCSGLDFTDPTISRLTAATSGNITTRMRAFEEAVPHLLSTRNFCSPTCRNTLFIWMRELPRLLAWSTPDGWASLTEYNARLNASTDALAEQAEDVTACFCNFDWPGFLRAAEPFASLFSRNATLQTPPRETLLAGGGVAPSFFSYGAMCGVSCQPLLPTIFAFPSRDPLLTALNGGFSTRSTRCLCDTTDFATIFNTLLEVPLDDSSNNTSPVGGWQASVDTTLTTVALCSPEPPSQPPSPPRPPPLQPTLMNPNENCWAGCNEQQGLCATGYCGTHGLCCRCL